MDELLMPLRYRVFLSYRSSDRELAEWLTRQLETYRVPRRMVGKTGDRGHLPARLTPVFRDRDEARSELDIETTITQFLRVSEQLVVLCSPKAAALDSWVPREIEIFRRERPDGLIHAVVGHGDPMLSFPAPLLSRGPNGEVRAPLAPDLRPRSEGGDGRRRGFIKLVAGLLGVEFDKLWQRERRRRIRQAAVACGIASLVALGGWRLAEVDREAVATSLVETGTPMVPSDVGVAAALDSHSEALGIKLALEGHTLQPSQRTFGVLTRFMRWKAGLRAIRETDLTWHSVAQSPSGRQAMALSAGGEVGVAALQEGTIVAYSPNSPRPPEKSPTLVERPNALTAVAVDRRGHCVAVGDTTGTVRLLSAPGRVCEIQAFEHHLTSPIVTVAIDPDGALIAAGAEQRTVMLGSATHSTVDHVPEQLTSVTTVQNDRITALTLFRAAESQILLAVGMGTGEVWLRQVSGLQEKDVGKRWTLLSPATGNEVFFIAASHEGKLLITSGNNDGIHLWDTVSGTAVATFPTPNSSIAALSVTEGGRIFFGDWSGSLFEAELKAGAAKIVARLPSHKKGIIGVVVDESKQAVLTWSLDGSLRETSIDHNARWPAWRGEISRHSLMFRDGTLYARDTENRVVAWDRAGKRVDGLDTKFPKADKVACDSGRRLIQARATDSDVIVEQRQGAEWTRIGQMPGVAIAAFNADCTRLAVSDGREVKSYATDQLDSPLWISPDLRPKYGVQDILFAQSGDWIAVANDDGISVISSDSGRLVSRLLEDNLNRVTAVVEDAELGILYALTGGFIAPLPTPSGAVASLCRLVVKMRANEEGLLLEQSSSWRTGFHHASAWLSDWTRDRVFRRRADANCNNSTSALP